MRLPGLGSLIFLSVAVQPKADIQCLIHPALILGRDLPGNAGAEPHNHDLSVSGLGCGEVRQAGQCQRDVSKGGFRGVAVFFGRGDVSFGRYLVP